LEEKFTLNLVLCPWVQKEARSDSGENKNDREINSNAGKIMAATDKFGCSETFLFSCI